jgi:hypothetical protein
MVLYVSPNYVGFNRNHFGKFTAHYTDGYICRVWFVGGGYHVDWIETVAEGMQPWVDTDFYTRVADEWPCFV